MTDGALPTGGNLVFSDEGNGSVNACDSTTGAKLWSFQTDAEVTPAQMSFVLNGKRCIAVTDGDNFPLDWKLGDTVLAFRIRLASHDRRLAQGAVHRAVHRAAPLPSRFPTPPRRLRQESATKPFTARLEQYIVVPFLGVVP